MIRATICEIIQEEKILLQLKKAGKFGEGKWNGPGGKILSNETPIEGVKREVYEETGLKTTIIKIFGVYSDPDRDPRGHTISIIFLLDMLSGEVKGNDDASDAKFFNVKKLLIISMRASRRTVMVFF